MRIIVVSLILTFISCKQNELETETQILDFCSFTIEAPSERTKIRAKGVDSYVGRIAIDSIDRLNFDLEWYSNKLTYQIHLVQPVSN